MKNEKAINLNIIAELIDTIGKEAYDELLSLLVTESQDICQKLKIATQANQYENVAQHAHKLVSSFGNLGLEQVSRTAQIIEEYAKQKKPTPFAFDDFLWMVETGLAQATQASKNKP